MHGCCVCPFLWANLMSSGAEQYRELARVCLELANKVPAKDRSTLLQMASEWERIADQQQWASDLRQKE
jgi:hypothetical protein